MHYSVSKSLPVLRRRVRRQEQRLRHLSTRVQDLERTTPVAAGKPSEELPALAPLLAPDTPDARQQWWIDLSADWQRAFRTGYFALPTDTEPTDAQRTTLLEETTLRLVGPGGMHPNVDVSLTDTTGLRHLTRLQSLFLTDHALTTLNDLAYLPELETLFVSNNRLERIDALAHLPGLRQLYVNGNRLTTLRPLAYCPQLETLYCNYNPLANLHGLTERHAGTLTTLVALPNERLSELELRRVERITQTPVRRS